MNQLSRNLSNDVTLMTTFNLGILENTKIRLGTYLGITINVFAKKKQAWQYRSKITEKLNLYWFLY